MNFCVPKILGLLRDVGRIFLTYILIYQQIFLGVVWAHEGLGAIQADLQEARLQGGSYVSKPFPHSTISLSKESAKLREEFKDCDWVFRESQDQLQTFYRWKGKVYQFVHPALLKSIQVLKSPKGEDNNTLYIKLLLDGLGQKNSTVGLENEGAIIIEDGIQVKGLVTCAPRVVSRAMASLDLQKELQGIDVETLAVHGDFKIEGSSTLNVQELHLHEGTFLNQGTLKFKEDGTADLHGNNLMNDHQIKGVKRLTFRNGRVLDHRTSQSQLRMKEGQFAYEGKEMISHPSSLVEAHKIHVKTHQGLSTFPHLQGDHLHLEAINFEGCDFKGLTEFKKLELISTTSPLTFSDPLILKGSLTAEAALIKNLGGMSGKGTVHFKAPSILNEAVLHSEEGKVILQGNVQHTKGLLWAYQGVEMEGETHVVQGDLYPQSAFTIKSKQGFTYDPQKLKTEKALKLVFQEPATFTQDIKTLGPLSLEGPSLEIGQHLEATITEAHTPFLKFTGTALSTSLKAWGKVEIASSAFTSTQDLQVEGDLKISASGPVVLKGTVIGKQDISIVGQSVSSEKEVFAHNTLQVESPGQITLKERAVGIEGLTLRVGGGLSYKDGGPNITPQTSGLQTEGTLEIISTPSRLYFKSPLSLLGHFLFKGPQAYNFSSLRAKQGFTFLTPLVEEGFGVVNRGKLMSEEGPLYVEGNTTHYPEGEIYTSQQASFKGHLNYLQGPMTVKEHLKVHTLHKWGLKYLPTVFKGCPLVTFAFDGNKQLNQPLESPETQLTLEGPSITVTQPFKVKEIKGNTPKLSFILQEAFTLTPPLQTRGELFIQAPSVVAEKKIQADHVQITSTKGDIILKDVVEGTQKVLLKTAKGLSYQTEGLQTPGLLHLILPPCQKLEIPLKLLGQLRVESPGLTNKTTLEARKGIEILTSSYNEDLWNLYNYGKMISDQGNIVLKGNFSQRDTGEVRAAKVLKIEGHYHDFRGAFVEGREGIEIKAKCPERVANYGLHSLRTLGLLKLIFREGGKLWRPLEVEGGIKIEVLPHKTAQTLKLHANLSSGKGLQLKASGHAIWVGEPSLPLIKIQSGGSFEATDAKTFDLVRGIVFSNHFFHIKAEQDITLGRWIKRKVFYETSRGNAIGPAIKAPYDVYIPNKSQFVSNEGMRLEAQTFHGHGGNIVVADEHLEVVAHQESSFSGTSVAVWKGNATIRGALFNHFIPAVQRVGEGLSPPYWIDYCLAQGRAPSFKVNGHIRFDIQKGRNYGGSILASGAIVGKEFIDQIEAVFHFKSGIIYHLDKTPYEILHPARCSDLTRRGWENKNILKLLQNERWNKAFPKRPKKKTIDDYFTWDSPIEIERDGFYSILPQLEGSQGIAFTGAKEALVQGKMIGSKLLIIFEKGLTVQTVGRSGRAIPYQPVMPLSLGASSSLVKLDSTGKGSTLFIPLVPIKYPLEEELQKSKRLILGPKGSEKLPFVLPFFAEGQALIEAFQQNIGYVPLTPECPDYLSLHRKVIQNGADLFPYLKPFLDNPKLLGLPANTPSQALIERGPHLFQGLQSSLPKEMALKLNEPILFSLPEGQYDRQALRSYLITPPSYHDPHVRDHLAQIIEKEAYLLGKKGSHTHFDRSRLIAKKGTLTTGTLKVTKQVDCVEQTPKPFIREGASTKLIGFFKKKEKEAPKLPKKFQYVSQPGGDLWVDQFDLHAEQANIDLGEMKSKILWLDIEDLLTTGTLHTELLIEDVGHLAIQRQHHTWSETHEMKKMWKRKNVWGRVKRKKEIKKQTVTLSEALPEEVSGLYKYGRVLKDPKEIQEIFAGYEKVRELQSLFAQGVTLIVGEGGWSPETQKKMHLSPLITRSLMEDSTSCRGMRKEEMQPSYRVVRAKVLSEGPIHPFSHQDIHLVGVEMEGKKGSALIEAKRDLTVEDASVMQPQKRELYNKKRAIRERGGFKELQVPNTITMPGKVVLKAQGKIQGHRPEVRTELVTEPPQVDLPRPLPHQELYDLCVGHRPGGNQALAMVARLGTSLLLFNPATSWAAGLFKVATDGVVAAMGGAALTSVASQTVGSAVMHQGNLKQIGKELTSSHFTRTLIIDTASAGLMHELSGTFNLPKQPEGWQQHLKVNAVRSMVSSGLNMTIGGVKPEEALLSAARMIVAGTLGGLGANEIAQLYSDGQFEYLTHKLAHAILGGGMGAILSDDIEKGLLSGAIGGFFGEIAGEELVKRLGDKQLTTVLGQMDETVMKAQLTAAIATMLAGEDIGVATFTAENAIRNNSFLVKKIGKKLLEKVASKQALKKVAKDIDTSPFSKETKKLIGRNHEYKAELLEREGAKKGASTLRAAQQEIKGQQIDKALERGVKYNHIEKAESAQRGLTRHIQRINNRLSYPELPQIERQALQKELSQSSKLLDYAKQFLKDNVDK
ncbi:hypothetical protein IM40_11330 (plasmid) [Candidatus Paracaedimonas acanthamoebae]|nr:hypothetical protein IM40_11330 [Candidatus Paracaedimonas acanthamoebae]